MRSLPLSLAVTMLLTSLGSCSGGAQETAALKLELKSLTGVLDTDIEAARDKFNADMKLAVDKNDLDEFLHNLRNDWGEEKSACVSTISKLDLLDAFIVRHEDYAKDLDLAGVKSRSLSKRHEVETLGRSVTTCLQSIREAHATIDSRQEWQKLGLEVARGDCLIIAPKGNWSIGGFVGACDAKGMNNPSIQAYAVEKSVPVGALLVRAGDGILGSGEFSAQMDKHTGMLEARCNDREYLNNSGTIAVRVIAFQAPGPKP